MERSIVIARNDAAPRLEPTSSAGPHASLMLADAEDVRRLDIAECIAGIRSEINASWREVFELNIQIAKSLPSIRCDASALRSALLNLLLNARDAMPNGGEIFVRAELARMDEICGASICISDQGVGMTPETIARAFDPFFTTKSDGMGGLGLPMVERFVRESKGSVLIESDFGAGTSVTLWLPAL